MGGNGSSLWLKSNSGVLGGGMVPPPLAMAESYSGGTIPPPLV